MSVAEVVAEDKHSRVQSDANQQHTCGEASMKSSKGWVKYVSASLAVAIVALPFASVGAQQSPGDAPTPVIRIKTRLVTVDVVVTDKWGKPVAGLHPEDFAVEENGRKQKVVVFATPEEANKPEAPMPTLGPGIYTNRPEFRVV